MYQMKLSPEELNVVLGSINQAQARLRGMQLRQALLPMHYCARLSWEALYEARQILRNLQGAPALRSTASQKASRGQVACAELRSVTPSIERVMAQLQSIEANNDLPTMHRAVQSCLQQLNGVTAILRQ